MLEFLFSVGLFFLAGSLALVVGPLGAQDAQARIKSGYATVPAASDTVFLRGVAGLARVGIASDSMGRLRPVRWQFWRPVRAAESMDPRVARFGMDSASRGLVLFQPIDPGATGYATILLDDGTVKGLRCQIVFQSRPGQGNSIVFKPRQVAGDP